MHYYYISHLVAYYVRHYTLMIKKFRRYILHIKDDEDKMITFVGLDQGFLSCHVDCHSCT